MAQHLCPEEQLGQLGVWEDIEGSSGSDPRRHLPPPRLQNASLEQPRPGASTWEQRTLKEENATSLVAREDPHEACVEDRKAASGLRTVPH